MTKVKGCKRLYKFKMRPPTRHPSGTHTNPLKSAGAAPLHTPRKHHSRIPPTKETKTQAQINNDILRSGSGLTIVLSTKRQKHRARLHLRSDQQKGPNSRQKSHRIKKNDRMGHQQKTLEAFGFLSVPTTRGQAVQHSNREVEAKLTEYSGTLTSTVP